MDTKTKEFTEEDIKNQIKPLSKNSFVRFFQKILRWWLGLWYGFCDKRPKLSAIVYKIFFFLVFSVGVTIWQFIVMTFLPYAFKSLNTGAAGWPKIPIALAGGRSFILFGDEQGWGYFIAFEIAVFTAQCINFPLQRNVTYRSHGNVYVQGLCYLIGWILVSVATNALWGVCNAFLLFWGSPSALNGLLKTLLTGVVSVVIFFFIFLAIFPDNRKMAKRARRRYEKLTSRGASPERVEKAEKKWRLWEEKALRADTEREYAKAKSQANAKAMSYFAIVKAADKAKTEEEKAKYALKTEKSFLEAVEAIKTKQEKEDAFQTQNAA